jgi:hypothetical protein
MSSIFGELDVESAADDPFAIPDNTYRAVLTDAKVGPTKAGDKIGLTLIYTINSDDQFNERIVSEWKGIPEPNDPKNLTEDESRQAAFLKQRMLSLGIPPERINSVTPDDLIGRECFITIFNKNGYMNIRKLVLIDEGVFDGSDGVKFE